jgi:hypothetical protein
MGEEAGLFTSMQEDKKQDWWAMTTEEEITEKENHQPEGTVNSEKTA